MPDAFQKHSAFLTLHAKRKKVLIFLLFDFHIFLLDDTINIDKVKKVRYNDNIMELKSAYFYTHHHAPDVRYVWSAAVREPMCSIPSHPVQKHQDVTRVWMP